MRTNEILGINKPSDIIWYRDGKKLYLIDKTDFQGLTTKRFVAKGITIDEYKSVVDER